MAFVKSRHVPLILFFLLIVGPVQSRSGNPHIINFRSRNLYPEGLSWDPTGQHFIVGSLRQRSIHTVSDAAVVETFVSDQTIPENATILGLTIDTIHNRVLAVVQSVPPLRPFSALAAYDIRTRRRVFLTTLHDDDAGNVITTKHHGANDVVVDFKGNAFVTNSVGNFIWKVDKDGEASVFSRSPVFTNSPLAVDPDAPFSECGLNGVAYVSKGYLLVMQSNTGKMYKVDADDGSARLVSLNEDLVWGDGIAIRSDGVVLVVSTNTLWFLKSQDNWAGGVVYDKIALDEEKFATSVTVGGGDRSYVLYGHVMEGIRGNSVREEFSIEEIKSKKENEEENVWIFVLLGLGLAYFLFWRFQMNKLVKNMDKKIQ